MVYRSDKQNFPNFDIYYGYNSGTANAMIGILVTITFAGIVNTKYVDERGNVLSDDIIQSGNIGEDYSTEQKAIDGYTFKEV